MVSPTDDDDCLSRWSAQMIQWVSLRGFIGHCATCESQSGGFPDFFAFQAALSGAVRYANFSVRRVLRQLGPRGLEPRTSSLSATRSSQLSYEPFGPAGRTPAPRGQSSPLRDDVNQPSVEDRPGILVCFNRETNESQRSGGTDERTRRTQERAVNEDSNRRNRVEQPVPSCIHCRWRTIRSPTRRRVAPREFDDAFVR